MCSRRLVDIWNQMNCVRFCWNSTNIWCRMWTSTLCSDKNHGDLSCVPVAGQAQKVIVDCLKADLILQAEDENHRIHPGSELKTEQSRGGLLKHWNKHCLTQTSALNLQWLLHQSMFSSAIKFWPGNLNILSNNSPRNNYILVFLYFNIVLQFTCSDRRGQCNSTAKSVLFWGKQTAGAVMKDSAPQLN